MYKLFRTNIVMLELFYKQEVNIPHIVFEEAGINFVTGNRNVLKSKLFI